MGVLIFSFVNFFWRGVRVVEGARLESVYTRKGIAGSNPALSANMPFLALNMAFVTNCVTIISEIASFPVMMLSFEMLMIDLWLYRSRIVWCSMVECLYHRFPCLLIVHSYSPRFPLIDCQVFFA